MIFIFFGPPGAGKGTQAAMLSKHYKIPHLSTGEIFRKKLKLKDNLSQKLKNTLDSGQLVSDSITNEIITDRIENSDCFEGFILDGYPRTIEQANFLKEIFNSKKLTIDKIIDIEIDQNTIINRIKSRQKIEKREDDNLSVIKTRITKYLAETKPLSDFYKSEFPKDFHIIRGDQEIEKIHQDILKITKNTEL